MGSRPAGPIGRWITTPPSSAVIDAGRYRAAVEAGVPDRRPLFTGIDERVVTWPDGSRERVDVVLLATGYRPDLGYLRPLDALTDDGRPLQRAGLSTTRPGLGYVGLEWQRSLNSASLRGVGRDAAHVVRRLLPHARTRRSSPS